MSRTSSSRRPVRAVLALTVGAASLVGLGQASAAPPVTYAVTGVSPAYVEAGVPDAFGVTLTGKGFTRKTRVRFSCGTGGTLGAPIAPATVTATRLLVQPPSCLPGAHDITITEGDASSPTSTLRGRLTFLATPRIAVPEDAAQKAVTPATGSWSGGTVASLEVADALPPKAAVQVRFTNDGVTRAVPGKAEAANPRRISFKVPPGLPGGTPEIAVSVFGILSEPVEQHFTYVSTIRATPAVWVRGAKAPVVKIDGAGFTGTPTVTICDQPAQLVAGKAPTSRTLHVTPPAWDTVLTTPEDQAAGTVCTVKVVSGSQTSVVSAGSTFTYAAY